MSIPLLPSFITNRLNQTRFEEVETSPFFLEELSLLENKRVAQYYQYIIENVELDELNPNNSYIMWVVGKVPGINITKPCDTQASRSSLPDVDLDVQKHARKPILQYLKEQYGSENVSSMITYQTLKGRGSLKEVIRAYGNISFDEMTNITKHIPDEAKMATELQAMKESRGESSIILQALENDREKFKGYKDKKPTKDVSLYEWCHIDDDGNLAGPLNKRFEQAIRLEGTKTNQSKHAAGIIISPEPLSELCPFIYDSKENDRVAGFEMNDLESIGLVKLDVLGIIALDKVMGIVQILETGDIQEE